MAAAILAQDFLAICLICSEGDINLSVSAVISRVENFQQHERHFGISTDDFYDAFVSLLFSGRYVRPAEGEYEKLDDIKFCDIIKNILHYHDVHFNDEGSYWSKFQEKYSDEIAHWNNCF